MGRGEGTPVMAAAHGRRAASSGSCIAMRSAILMRTASAMRFAISHAPLRCLVACCAANYIRTPVSGIRVRHCKNRMVLVRAIRRAVILNGGSRVWPRAPCFSCLFGGGGVTGAALLDTTARNHRALRTVLAAGRLRASIENVSFVSPGRRGTCKTRCARCFVPVRYGKHVLRIPLRIMVFCALLVCAAIGATALRIQLLSRSGRGYTTSELLPLPLPIPPTDGAVLR